MTINAREREEEIRSLLGDHGLHDVGIEFHENIPRADHDPVLLAAQTEIGARQGEPTTIKIRSVIDDEVRDAVVGRMIINGIPGAFDLQDDTELFFQHTIRHEIAHILLRSDLDMIEECCDRWASKQLGLK